MKATFAWLGGFSVYCVPPLQQKEWPTEGLQGPLVPCQGWILNIHLSLTEKCKLTNLTWRNHSL